MKFLVFGNENKPVIMLLHGGGLSWWSWKQQIEALKKDYYVVTPIIDGHGDAWETDFISIKESAEHIAQYVKENFGGRVFALCGLSIGAQIVVELLSKEYDITDYAIIESALVYPMKMTTMLTAPMFNMCYGLIKKKWFAKLQAKSLNVPDELFVNYFEESSRMTKKSLINMTKSNGNYAMPASICNTKAKVLILVGEKELPVMKKSAKLLNDNIKGSSLKVLDKSGHGEISLVYPDKYLDLIQRFFAQD